MTAACWAACMRLDMVWIARLFPTLTDKELCFHVIIADESLRFRCSMRALLKAALSSGGHTHANSYSLKKKGKEEEKMRSWWGGMETCCVVQEDEEQGSLIYLVFHNPKGCSGQQAAAVNRDTTSSVHLQWFAHCTYPTPGKDDKNRNYSNISVIA